MLLLLKLNPFLSFFACATYAEMMKRRNLFDNIIVREKEYPISRHLMSEEKRLHMETSYVPSTFSLLTLSNPQPHRTFSTTNDRLCFREPRVGVGSINRPQEKGYLALPKNATSSCVYLLPCDFYLFFSNG